MSLEELQLKYKSHKKTEPKSKKPEKLEYAVPLIDSIPLNNESRPAVLYMRISTQYQQNDGFSLEHQDSVLTDYCKKNNLYIVEKYVEVISGGTMERAELKRMLADLKPGYCVVCNSTSRLSRNLEDLFEINKKIKQAKASLILLDISVDTSTPNGKLILSLMGSVSEIERAQISDRVSSVMRYLQAEQKLIKKPHYGWTQTKNGLVEKEDEQAVIEAIKLMVNLEPTITSGKIARQLNNKGFTNRNNKKFHVTTIESIIRHNNIPYKHFKQDKEKNIKEQTVTNQNVNISQNQIQNNTSSNVNQDIQDKNLQSQNLNPNFNPNNYVPNIVPQSNIQSINSNINPNINYDPNNVAYQNNMMNYPYQYQPYNQPYYNYKQYPQYPQYQYGYNYQPNYNPIQYNQPIPEIKKDELN